MLSNFDRAHHRVDRLAVLEGLGDRLRIVRSRPLYSLGDRLNDAIAEQREAFGVEALRLELRERLGRVRRAAGIDWEGEERALAGGPRDLPELGGRDAVAGALSRRGQLVGSG